MQKINFIPPFFFETFHGVPERYYQLVENFIFMQKLYLTLTYFLKYYKDIENLLWVLWVQLATPTKNNSTNWKETLIFIWKQKINFILQFFLTNITF